jgi:hypothetical protein
MRSPMAIMRGLLLILDFGFRISDCGLRIGGRRLPIGNRQSKGLSDSGQPPCRFVIRAWCLVRHQEFVIRHSVGQALPQTLSM